MVDGRTVQEVAQHAADLAQAQASRYSAGSKNDLALAVFCKFVNDPRFPDLVEKWAAEQQEMGS